MKDENYFIYAGNPDRRLDWILIKDTKTERFTAIRNGYNAFSITSFSKEYEQGKKEPNRKGDLWLDFDSKEDEAKAIAVAKNFILDLQHKFNGFDITMLKYFLSGNKGCHVCIPAEMYGDVEGSPYLPKIHKSMISKILSMYLPGQREEIEQYIDMNLYCQGRGRLLRVANSQRLNGRYKVEVSPEEFFMLDYNDLKALTLQPRNIVINTTPPCITGLEKIFNKSLLINDIHTSQSDKIKSMMKCKFMQHCIEDAETLSEPEWFMMLRILVKLGNVGLEYAHKFSKDYPKYSEEETNEKFEHSKGYITTCKNIRELFMCPESCRANTPLGKYECNTTLVNKFIEKYDGLYYIGTRDEEDGVLISSYIKIKGIFRNFDGFEWGIIVELKDPEGNTHTLNFYKKDTIGDCDTIIADLVDAGLELTDEKSIKRLKDYIRAGRSDNIYTLVNNVGWKSNNVFVLPDVIYSYSNNKNIIVTEKFPLLNCSCSLEEWNKHVGEKCIGNPLLIFLVNFAMTGPLLRPCGIDGGGIHLYGTSSSGKTTSAYVAGSVYGGKGNGEGYKYSWNGTSNGFEKIAYLLNDLYLYLDEMGQATSKVVSTLAYMLANGFGRVRMKSDASVRPTYKWILSFLSTGEMTLSDKIEEDEKGKTMAGQTVRIIDIPIDCGVGEPAFHNIHGMKSSREFSNYLKNASCKYYGIVIRELLAKLFGGCEETLKNNIQQLKDWKEEFINKYCSGDSQSQVGRIAERFGMAYAAGLFATKNNIVAWSEQDSIDSVVKYYNTAVKIRGGLMNMEIIKAKEALFKEINKNGPSKYIHKNDNNRNISDFHGYFWNEDEYTYYLITPSIFKQILGSANKDEFCKFLVEKKLMSEKTGSNWSITKNIQNKTIRGYLVSIPILEEDKPASTTYSHKNNEHYYINEDGETVKIIDNIF